MHDLLVLTVLHIFLLRLYNLKLYTTNLSTWSENNFLSFTHILNDSQLIFSYDVSLTCLHYANITTNTRTTGLYVCNRRVVYTQNTSKLSQKCS